MREKVLKSLFIILFMIPFFLLSSCNKHKPNITEETYTVIWQDEDGSLLEVDKNVKKGTLPTYDGIAPSKENTDEYSYTFIGWDKEIDKVYSDITYTATYKSIVNVYTVSFVNYDNTLLESYELEYGKMPSYLGGEPIKPSSDTNSYTFIGWDKDLSIVTEDTTYIASFIETPLVEYKLSFKGYTSINNFESITEIYSTTISKGSIPNISFDMEKSFSIGDYKYTFKEWDKAFDNVLEDMEYIATYDKERLPYHINVDYFDTTFDEGYIKSMYMESLDKTRFRFDLYKEGYIFLGYEVNGILVFDELGNIVNDIELEDEMTFKALFSDRVLLNVYYTVYNPLTNLLEVQSNILIDGLGEVIESDYVDYNKETTLYAEASDNYEFIGWYFDNELISDNSKYDYLVSNKDIQIEARFKYKISNLQISTYNSSLGLVKIEKEDSLYEEKDNETLHSLSNVTISVKSIANVPFLGWYTLDNKFVSNKEKYEFVMSSTDISLIAKWDYFAITYDLDGGENNINNPTYYTSSDSKILLNKPTKTNYDFLGFTYNGLVIDSIDTSALSDYHLVASWGSFKLTTNTNILTAGTYTSYDNQIISMDTLVSLTANPYLGYKFIGWSKDSSIVSTDLTYTFKMPKDSIVYTAIFEINLEMENFIFNSSLDDCTITGLKDNTVTSIVVPNYVTSISLGAFNSTSSLDSLTLPFIGERRYVETDSNMYPLGYIFGQDSYTGGVLTPQSYWTTKNKIKSEEYYIPKTLTNVTLTDTEYLQYGAFYNCTNLKNITLSSNTKTIENKVFYYCRNLKSLFIPASVTSILGTIEGCESVNSIEVDENNPIYDSRDNSNAIIITNTNSIRFGCMNTVITDSIKRLEDFAFEDCIYLRKINLLNVEYIGCYAFHNCKGLNSIVIPKTVKDIMAYAFDSCTNLSSVVFENDMTAINLAMFMSCKNLRNITIKEGVEKIYERAFMYSGIVNIELPSTLSLIGSSAFQGCSDLKNVYYNGTIEQWCNIKITANTFHLFVYAENFYILDNDGDVLHNGKKYSLATDVVIPNTVEKIYYNFYGCKTIKNLTINEGVEFIANAFYNCNSLETVTINEGVTTITNYMFSGCKSLQTIYLPSTIESIGKNAFSNCDSITTIIYNGSESDFGNVTIDSSNTAILNATIVFNE